MSIQNQISTLMNFWKKRKETPTGSELLFGLKSLDNEIGGLDKGTLCTIAGASGSGKTSLVHGLILNCLKKGHRVLLFSLEMSVNATIMRLLSRLTGIQFKKIKEFDLTKDEQKKIITALDVLKTSKLTIWDDYNVNTNYMDSLVQTDQQDLVIIDYLDLCADVQEVEHKINAIDNAYRNLDMLSKTKNCSVVVIAAITKLGVQRKPPVPIRSDLRNQSGYHGDYIITLGREELITNNASSKGKVFIHIAKNRNAEENITWESHFDGKQFRFYD